MMIKTVLSAAVLALAACSNPSTEAGSITAQQVSTDSNQAAAPAGSLMEALPSFTLVDANGKQVNLQSFKGKKLFVNLWATWCPPCRREMPSIEKLARSVDKNKVAFVLLSLDNNFAKAKAYAKRRQLSLPIYYPAENLPELFNVQVIPTTFIFNESGKLVQRINGGDDYDTDAYKKLLR